jgi:P-type Cu+ transporter
LQERTYRVTGMSCASCAAHVQKEVSRLDGVESADVNISTEKLYVRFDSDKLDFSRIKKVVEDGGYGLEDNSRTLTLTVEGMTCASCAAAVERALHSLVGVKSASVNLATNRAAIEYDAAQVTAAQIKKAISDAGYTPRTEDSGLDEQEARRTKMLHNMRIRVIIASVFALPELYIGMTHMLPFLKLPLPMFMDHHMFPLNFALVQLVLTIPILLAGSHFYINGFKTLWKKAPNMDTLVAIGTGSAFLYSVYALARIYLGDMGFVGVAVL